MESADVEGNHSIQPSSNEGQNNSAYQPDAGLAYQQGACIMVCTAASLSKWIFAVSRFLCPYGVI